MEGERWGEEAGKGLAGGEEHARLAALGRLAVRTAASYRRRMQPEQCQYVPDRRPQVLYDSQAVG